MQSKQTNSFRDKFPSDKALVKVLSDFYAIKSDTVYRFDLKTKSLIDLSGANSYPVNGYNLFWEYFYPSENDLQPTYDELLIENQRLRFELEQFKDVKPKQMTL